MSPKRTVKHKLKHGCSILFMMMLTLFVILFGFMFFNYSRVTTDAAYSVSGKVTSISADKYLKVTVDGDNKNFFLYKTSRDYYEFTSQIHDGDVVKIYTENMNIDEIIQLEKDGLVIYSAKTFQKKYLWVSIFLFAGGAVMCFLLVRAWRKYMM